MGWRIGDHTADVVLEVWAPTWAELVQEALQALVHYIADGPVVCRNWVRERPIQVRSESPDLLLADFLNEVLTWSIIDHVLYCHLEGEKVTERAITGQLRGVEAQWQHDVKAVTYHDLRVEQRSGQGWYARLVLDI